MGEISTLIFGDAPDENSESDSDFSTKSDSEEEDTKEWEPAVLEVGMTEADFSNKNLGVGGAIIISAWISHKDKGTLAKLIFSGADSSKSVTMETTMTVADFSEKGLGASGGIMLSAFLPKCT
jgi:hypothetical protein